MLKDLSQLLLRLGLILALLLPVSALSAPLNSQKPITILTLDWTSQVVLSHIAGSLLEQLGYPVRYLSRDADSQWFLLSSEKANLQMEIWEGTMGSRFDNLIERQLLVDAGSHPVSTREDWWYPDYVEKLCPGLPDWQALNDCSYLFSEGGTKGIYYSGPWEKPDEARIRALHLNYQVHKLKDSHALREKLETAIQGHLPILIFNWTPNWVEAVYPGKFVEFPPYNSRCENDKSWGINKNLNWDCGNPVNGWLKKAVSKNFADDWPCAFQLIQNIRFNNAMIAEVTALVEIQGLTAQAAAKHWLANHTASWQAWLSSLSCKP